MSLHQFILFFLYYSIDMKILATYILVFLLIISTISLHIAHRDGTGSSEPLHEGTIQNTLLSHNISYYTYVRFMTNINSLLNNAGFIKRTLIINYNHQFPTLQITFT